MLDTDGVPCPRCGDEFDLGNLKENHGLCDTCWVLWNEEDNPGPFYRDCKLCDDEYESNTNPALDTERLNPSESICPKCKGNDST